MTHPPALASIYVKENGKLQRFMMYKNPEQGTCVAGALCNQTNVIWLPLGAVFPIRG